MCIFSSRSKEKSQYIGWAFRRCAEKMAAVLNTRPVQWNGFNKPQKESGRHVARSAGQCCWYSAVSGPFVDTFSWWLNDAMQVALLIFILSYLLLLNALPRMTFSLQGEMMTAGRGGFQISHETLAEWCSREEEGTFLLVMHIRIVVSAQTDMDCRVCHLYFQSS